MGRLVLQEELNLFLNRSNVAFYDFTSLEAAVGAFYKLNAGSWARLRLSRLNVQFDGRTTRDADGNPTEIDRKDEQFGLNFQLNWGFTENLTLFADYQLIRNDTNEGSELFDFLNYTNNIASVSIQANY
jgi:outer membrane protein assembly factor BamA